MPQIINFTKEELCGTFGTNQQQINTYKIDTPTIQIGTEISLQVNGLQQLMANRKFGLTQAGSNYHISTGNDGRVSAMELCSGSVDPELPACPVCVSFSESLPTAPSGYIGNIRGVNDAFNPTIDCWAINTNSVLENLKLDLYIDNKLVMTTEGREPAPDIVAAHGGHPDGLYNFKFDLEHEFWWQDGTQKSVKVCFHGTKTQLVFDNPSKTTIGKLYIGSGNCIYYRDDVVLPSHGGNVTYSPAVDFPAAGLSVVPHVQNYTVIETDTYRLGLPDVLGCAIDWIGKKTDTESWLTQRDSGIQGYQIDPYIGDPSTIQDIFVNQRGYTTTAPDRNWNGLPQGVYEAEMLARGTYTPGANFGNGVKSKSWDQATKTLTTVSDLWQYAFVNAAGQKVKADNSTNVQSVRVIQDNVFEIEYTLNLSLDFLSTGLHPAALSNYAFYAFDKFKKCKYYSGGAPFTDSAALSTVDLTVLSNTNYVNNRSEYHDIVATEKWIAVTTSDESECIAMVWNQKHRFKGSIHVENKHLDGGAVLYLNPFRHRPNVYRDETIVDKVYMVMGTIAQIREFAYKLNGYPCQ